MQDQEAAFEDRDLLTLDFFEGRTFAVVLVGKDGGEKFRSTEPVEPRDLFDRIDAMPMRRREVRERGAG